MDGHDRPRYMISIAAELVGMHPQTLRIYEQKGLVRPQRTPGNTRLYSERDLERLRLIQGLTTELGLNLAGVEAVLALRDEVGSTAASPGSNASFRRRSPRCTGSTAATSSSTPNRRRTCRYRRGDRWTSTS
jgi:DNA-binding transcriptional MerR regulator